MSRYTLMDYFSIYVEEWDSLLEEFLRHLAMTSFSVVLALIIAVPLGIFITRNKAVQCGDRDRQRDAVHPLYGAARHGHSLSGRG